MTAVLRVNYCWPEKAESLRDDDVADRRIGLVAGQVSNKRAVDFQRIERVLFQKCQRCMSGSEVIEHQSNAKFFE